MFGGDEAIKALREALAFSPDNIALRRHLATTLLDTGHPGEAEQEFRHLLALNPADVNIQLGLAAAFERQGKTGEALVVIEALAREPSPPARAFLLQARLLLRHAE